jgi:hypothetical protein
MSKFRAWFTDARRQGLHAALGTLAAFAVAAGWVNDNQSTALIGFAGSVLAVIQGVLAVSLLRRSEAARWFGTIGRGLIFALAAAAGALGIAFGIVGDAQVTHWLGLVTVALTALSSFVSVVNVQTVDNGATLPAAGPAAVVVYTDVPPQPIDPGATDPTRGPPPLGH